MTLRFDARSHGESFLDLFSSRLEPRGLYLLDEPEAPLSPRGQLELLALVVRAAEAGAQFIIATHAPIVLACPGARIWSFDSTPIREAAFDDLDHVAVMRDFLRDPSARLSELTASAAPSGSRLSPARGEGPRWFDRPSR